jgi:hypothetical protein
MTQYFPTFCARTALPGPVAVDRKKKILGDSTIRPISAYCPAVAWCLIGEITQAVNCDLQFSRSRRNISS